MNRIALAAAAALFCSAMAFGQSPSVIIQNQEDSPFYYVMDPADLSGLTPGSPMLASKVAGYFAAADSTTTFATLAPQADARLTDLAAGSHLLVGFFLVANADTCPVRVITIQVDPSIPDRFYSIFSETAQLAVRRGVGKLAQFAAPAATQSASAAAGPASDQGGSGSAGGGSQDGTAAAAASTAAAGGAASTATTAAAASTAAAPSTSDQGAAALQTLASFPATYDPGFFSREANGDFKVLPISQARSWAQAGTRISEVQGSMDQSGLRLVLTVPGGFSQSVSYFLYVFDSRAAGRDNSLTLEIEPLARPDRGACILWQKGSDPRLVGSVKTTDTSVELDIPGSDLASGPFAAAGPSPTVDLTAGSYDRSQGTWEEYYYTTLSAPK